MTSNLYWEPAVRDKKRLSVELKLVLRERLPNGLNVTMDEKDLPYLNGLVDANCAGAQELIDAIEKYGEINLMEEW